MKKLAPQIVPKKLQIETQSSKNTEIFLFIVSYDKKGDDYFVRLGSAQIFILVGWASGAGNIFLLLIGWNDWNYSLLYV